MGRGRHWSNRLRHPIRTLALPWRWWRYSGPYRARFGLRGGLGVASAVADLGYRLSVDSETVLRVPGWRCPLRMRAGTSDVRVFEQVVVQRELEFECEPPPKTIIDAGANIGISARVFAERWPEAEILALELEARNADLLERNVIGYPKIQVVRGALWRDDEGVVLRDPEAEENSFAAIGADGAASRIPSFTVGSLLDRQGWQTVDLLKMDIEGGEIAVFEEASDWIGRCRRIVVELHDRFQPGCTAAFERVLATNGIWRVWPHGEYMVAERVG